MLKERFKTIIDTVQQAAIERYGDRLQALAVFGSVARGTMRPDSDIDLLLVIKGLPRGRMARVREFDRVEKKTAVVLAEAAREGIHTTLAPVFKTPKELRYGSALFFDMTDQAEILYDPNRTLTLYLEELRNRLKDLGARRVHRAGGYYWLLKPDIEPHEDFEL